MDERTEPRYDGTLQRMIRVAACCLAVALSFDGAAAQTSESESFRVTGSLSSGGGESSSASFRVIGSIDASGFVGASRSSSFLLESGDASWLVGTTFDDDDGDSITNGEEASVRGGDGNGDSIPDQLQASVASLAGVGTPVTADAESGGCRAISLASTQDSEDLGPSARYRFPHGLVRLRLACDAQGAEAVVRLLYHAAPDSPWPPADLRAFGVRAPDFEGQVSYYSLPFEEAGVADIGGSRVPYVVLRLHDGAYGDATGQDGIIDLTVGPATESRPVRR